MLVEFRVSNYRSFKDEALLSMVAANLTARDKDLDGNNVTVVDKNLKLLTGAAIYGANASGKSNLLAAIRFMRGFILNSSRESQGGDKIDVEPFRLTASTADRPSEFEIVFVAEGRRYRYGFTVTAEQVISEWLFYTPRTREARLFERDHAGIHLADSFKEGRGLEERTRANALFLSVVAQFNGATAIRIQGWFRQMTVISGLTDMSARSRTLDLLSEASYREEILDFVRKLDLDIKDVAIQRVEVPPGQLLEMLDKVGHILPGGSTGLEKVIVSTQHRTYSQSGQATGVELLDLDWHESEGTKKLLSFAGPFVDTLRNGKVLVIDELDARLHPLITRSIISLFNCKRSNPLGAQLIFTTHDTNLLSNKIFRRDQIWFTEKDRAEASHLVSLAEYKVRNDASFELDYIRGKYGAVPYLGDFDSLLDGIGAEEP